MHRKLLLPCCSLLGLLAQSAAAAPIQIEARMASAPPTTEPGTGVCATAVHVNDDDVVTNILLARAYLARAPGMDKVDGKVTFPSPVIDFRNGDAGAGGDYTSDQPFPFTGLNVHRRPRFGRSFAGWAGQCPGCRQLLVEILRRS